MQNVDELLERAVGAGHVAGAVMMASAPGLGAYSSAFGTASRDGGGRISPDTIFEISSMVRPILTVAALQLVEAGKLALDEPLGAILPGMQASRRLAGFDRSGSPMLCAARGVLTLRTLLSHTSGLHSGAWGDATLRSEAWLDISRRVASTPLLFDPGSRWHYGGDLGIVGVIIERVTGIPLGDYLRDRIFDPLGLRDTGFYVEYGARRRVAGGWRGLASTPGETAFYSTPMDYFGFVRAVLGRDGSLLSSRSFELMQCNQIGDLTVPKVLGLETVDVPGEVNFYPEIRLYPGTECKWSLGFMVSAEAVSGGPSAGSLTCAAPSSAYCWINPDSGVAGLLFARRSPGCPDLVDELFADLQRTVYQGHSVTLPVAPRRRSVLERMFEGWSKESWATWWPM
jgi:CubicO group peptidase (beta-lactamase class C family)